MLLRPSYLTIPAFGLDISDRSFKYLRFKKKHGRVHVDLWDQGEIPEGVVVGGEINKPEELGVILSQAFAGKKLSFAVVSLPEERGFVRDLQIPVMASKDIRSVLEFKLAEHIPLRPQEVVFDYVISRPTYGHKGKHMDVVLYAFPKIFLKKYVDVLSEAGIMPIAFELEAQAIARSALSPVLDHSVLLVDFGAMHVSFMIVYKGVVYFTATIDVAGFELDRAIAQRLKVSFEKAQQLKIDIGLSKKEGNEEVYNALLPIIEKIKDEMRIHIDFWQTHNPETGPIKEIVLSGADANLHGLSDFLYSQLQLPVRRADVWGNVVFPSKYIPPIHFRKSLGFAGTVGLAMRAVNSS